MSKYIFLCISFFMALNQHAQTSRIQFIHNSADTSLSVVDVYVGSSLIADNLPFRTATSFLDVPAISETTISIANANSTNESDALESFQFTFVTGEKYVMVANGQLNSFGYNPPIPLSLSVFTGAKETLASASVTEFLFCHGATDLPIVDLVETELLQLPAFESISHGSIEGYQSFFAASYVFSLTNETNESTYGTFSAPFDEMGLGGIPVTIVTSGYFNQAANSFGESLGLWLAKPTGGPLLELPALSLNLSARCQMIHNSADAALNLVDVYLNGDIVLNDFAFRTSTPFMHLPAGNQVEIAVAGSNSFNVSEAYFVDTLEILSGETYTMVLNGVLNESLYSPALPLEWHVASGMNESVSTAENVRFLFHHGVTDGQTVNIFETSNFSVPFAEDLSFGDFSTNFELPIDDFVLTLLNDEPTEQIESYLASFSSNFPGQIITVILSGFQNPTLNNNGPMWGLWIASENGGNLIPLQVVPSEPVFAEVQFLHNSADDLLSICDIYVNDELYVSNFAFRYVTPFMSLPAEVPLSIAITPPSSTSSSEAMYIQEIELVQGQKYLAAAHGILSLTGYNPAPAFQFDFMDAARSFALISGNCDVLCVNGCTDISSADMTEILTSTDLCDNLPFRGFSEYTSFSAQSDYFIRVNNGAESVLFGEYDLPLSTWTQANKALTIFVSGFLNPVNNSNGPGLEVWAATSDGAVAALPVHVGVNELSNGSSIQVYPNPTTERVTISGHWKSTGQLDVTITNMNGEVVSDESEFISENTFSFSKDLKGLPSGLYAVNITDGKSIMTQRLNIVN
jgi:hypothetical protein